MPSWSVPRRLQRSPCPPQLETLEDRAVPSRAVAAIALPPSRAAELKAEAQPAPTTASDDSRTSTPSSPAADAARQTPSASDTYPSGPAPKPTGGSTTTTRAGGASSPTISTAAPTSAKTLAARDVRVAPIDADEATRPPAEGDTNTPPADPVQETSEAPRRFDGERAGGQAFPPTVTPPERSTTAAIQASTFATASAESRSSEAPSPAREAEAEPPAGVTAPATASALFADRIARGPEAQHAGKPTPAAIEVVADGTADEPTAPTESGLPLVAGAGLAAVLPLDLAALDAALESFLHHLEEAGQAVWDTIGGLGPAPWLTALAAALTAYEATRRKRRVEEPTLAEVPT
jgi:hypothetical protein